MSPERKDSERVSDRYGSVKLFTSISQEETVPLDQSLSGKRGQLLAVVKETRESNHIGDLFHGILPTKPSVGDEFVLGKGVLFFDNIFTVGLKPMRMRKNLWLDIKKLYKAHCQTVELYFIETK